MADFVSLTCPSCNGKLQINKDLSRFACGYCGTEFIVNRGGGVVSLSPVVEGLKRVERGVDRTASELAIVRLTREISVIERRWSEMSSERKKWRIGVGGCGTILLIVAVIAIYSVGDLPTVAIESLLLGVGLLLIAFKVLGESSEEKRLNKLWSEKQAELARHQQIVKA